MNLKKILAGILVGTFAFGVTFSNVSAATSKDKKNPAVQTTENKQPPQIKDSDAKNPPEPPKDASGKQLPPPDKKDSSDKDKKSGDKHQPPQFENDRNQQKK